MHPTDTAAPPVTLASPLELACGVTLTNRIAKSAMSEQLGSRTNDTTPELLNLYRRWASGGPGLQVTGNVMVDRRSIGEPLNVVIEDDRDLDGLKAWAEAAKSGGAPAIVQLNHPGRQTLRSVSSLVVAPSAVRVNIPGTPFPKPRALEVAEIEDIIERFATAAEISVRAGFDGIQLHGAHGYLISQFLSPLVNRRDDEWGGDAERRRRFVIELARATRAAVGPDKIVAIKLNSADFQRGGFSEEESLEVVRLLGEEGLDFLEISGGTYEKPAMMGATSRKMSERSAAREAYFLDFAAKAKQVTTMPLMITGGLRSSSAMTDALDDGIDIVGIARPVCLEPDLPRRLINDPGTVARLKPIRTGIAKLDSPADLWWSNIQLRRLGAGKEPRRALTGWESIGHALVRDGINGVRRKRS
ncbi:MAG: NADH:flavin oxidoreductase/NADH oxidase family protein [Thermoleophilaceae bacterium]|nr:NADH:flavin oxidoreductase/NADH oxidase family protein [Thermoleophilaceae bacterium]